MIGMGLKKYAQENGLKVDAGVAYGSLKGYAVTMREGENIKQILFATSFSDPAQSEALLALLNSRDLTEEFRVKNLTVAPNGINIVFNDTVGTMKKIEAFLEWFLPLLSQYGASGADVCNECGMQITDGGTWVLKNGAVAFHVHSGCARKIQESTDSENTKRKEERTGSYATGAVGALIGAALGSIVWAIIWAMGYLAALAGLAIGFLANKGYGLLKGKEGKGKIAVLIVAIIVGVLLGTALGYGADLVIAMNEESIPMEYFGEMVTIIMESDEFWGEFALNSGLGILFAALGTFGMLRQESKNVADEKVKILK